MVSAEYLPRGFLFRSASLILGVVVLTCFLREKKANMRAAFTVFPDGRVGVGLLLLRAAIGSAVALQGAGYCGGDASGFGKWVVGLLMILAGISVLLGFLTMIAAALAGVATVLPVFPGFPEPAFRLATSIFPTALWLAVAVALVLTGPGGLSVDARLFGFREIVIQRTGHDRSRLDI